jgi:streptogramin lyase
MSYTRLAARQTAAIFSLVALIGTGSAGSPSIRADEPKIVEVGPTFRSILKGLTIGPDGAIWLQESDGVAKLSRAGAVRELRRPDDCRFCIWSPENSIGYGPDGAVWTNGGDRLLRFADGRVSARDVQTAPPAYGTISAFAATRSGVYFRSVHRGLHRIDERGAQRALLADIGYVASTVAGPFDGLWLLTTSSAMPSDVRGPNRSLGLYQAGRWTPGIAPSFIARYNVNAACATVSSNALIAAVSPIASYDPPSASTIVSISVNGTVRTVAALPQHKPFYNIVGSSELACGADGTIWITEPETNRVARIAPDGTVREIRDGVADGATPASIAADADGSAWFTDPWHGTVGHITANGTVRTYGNGLPLLNIPGAPAATSDGAVWFPETLTWHPRIARLARDGSLREFAVPPDTQQGPWLRAAGTDVIAVGALSRFGTRTVYATSFPIFGYRPAKKTTPVYRIHPNGTMSRFSTNGCLVTQTNVACLQNARGRGELRTPSQVTSAVLAPDGNIWFTDIENSVLGRVEPNNRITYFTRGLSRWRSGPQQIIVGPDGALWFTEVRNRIGRITLDGRITEFSDGIPFRSFVGGIVAGRDGNLWFTLYNGNELVRMTPRGVITRFRKGIYPSRGFDESALSVPVADAAGNIWFNEPQGGRIARATLP